MDLLTEFVAVAHLKLRLELYCKYPVLFREVAGMANQKLYIPQPIELAGMRSRLLRAKKQEKDIAATGMDYDRVQDGIDEAHDALKGHVGDLKSYEGDLRRTILGMLERSNGNPTDGGSDGRQSTSDEKVEANPEGEKVEVKADEVGPLEQALGTQDGSQQPEKLTVNGVSEG
jgi:hypothetical protein